MRRRRSSPAAEGYRPYRGRRRHSRAALCALLALALLACGVLVWARFVEPGMLRLERVEVHSSLVSEPLRIVALADLHIGRALGAARLAAVMEAVAAESPDVVVFLGDFYDDYNSYTEGDEGLLASLLDPPALRSVPKYAIWGNHDFGGGAARAYARLMEQAGWTLLQNEAVELAGNIRLLGADDLIWGEPDIMPLRREGAFHLLLAHEPDYADAVTGIELQLSGHTHGLQINLPFAFYRARVAPPGGQNYLAGLYRKADGTQLYVSRGIGMSLLPLRFASPPELTVVEVRP